MAIERLNIGLRLEDVVVSHAIKKAQSLGLSLDSFVEKLIKDWYTTTQPVKEKVESIIPTDVTPIPKPQFPKPKKKSTGAFNVEE